MIVIGYQGIGKTTLAERESGFIDLESSNFWHNSKRPDDWYIYYCKIAISLSKLGYIVFVSSHIEVRNYLDENADGQLVVAVFPSLDIEEEWVEMLERRYKNDKSDKNYRAWLGAKANFKDNIWSMMSFKFTCKIKNMNYSLAHLVLGLHTLESTLDAFEISQKKY